jgi:AraC-like DNA-binding protein
MFVLLLAPDALFQMTGIGADRYLNRVCPLAAALDESWQAMALDVLHAHNDEYRVKLVEAFLEPRWLAARSINHVSWGPAQRQGEWSRAAISRVYKFAKGRGKRQLERRTRTMTGWSARGLKNLSRVEHALLMAARANQPRVNWASIAAEAGYADQSHLCRELRRYTGLSPQQLWLHLQNEQSLWVYKAWFGSGSAGGELSHLSDAQS